MESVFRRDTTTLSVGANLDIVEGRAKSHLRIQIQWNYVHFLFNSTEKTTPTALVNT